MMPESDLITRTINGKIYVMPEPCDGSNQLMAGINSWQEPTDGRNQLMVGTN
jgi:hypothetical protein